MSAYPAKTIDALYFDYRPVAGHLDGCRFREPAPEGLPPERDRHGMRLVKGGAR